MAVPELLFVPVASCQDINHYLLIRNNFEPKTMEHHLCGNEAEFLNSNSAYPHTHSYSTLEISKIKIGIKNRFFSL